ncbi:helix-turn-helix domain-containing protein [Nonomuraea sp. NPDC049480]|uniref:helix-turn-helix domain-containing protein n=1 Tax=Nonomuraea sp. NPDC049480 TaxID=3364353 RepID=UPI0037A61665
MYAKTPIELGALVRRRRRALGRTQQAVADELGVSRQWIVRLEAGRATLELGLVMRALGVLGLTMEIKDPAVPRPAMSYGRSIDLDEVLAAVRRNP